MKDSLNVSQIFMAWLTCFLFLTLETYLESLKCWCCHCCLQPTDEYSTAWPSRKLRSSCRENQWTTTLVTWYIQHTPILNLAVMISIWMNLSHAKLCYRFSVVWSPPVALHCCHCVTNYNTSTAFQNQEGVSEAKVCSMRSGMERLWVHVTEPCERMGQRKSAWFGHGNNGNAQAGIVSVTMHWRHFVIWPLLFSAL